MDHVECRKQIVTITGASSGIGEATAKLLAENGTKIVLGARRTEKLQSIVGDIRKHGGTAEFKAVDVTQRNDVKAFVEFAKEKFSRVDVIVTNAGIMPLSPMKALKIDEWDRMIDVNIRGVLHGIAAVFPIMQAQGAGQIINLSSIGGHTVSPTAAVYCATKFAVRAISEGLRQEDDKIRVTVISPGVVESELADSISDEQGRAEMKEFRKIAIAPDAIARAIRFAIEQPADVDVSELIVRPTASPF